MKCKRNVAVTIIAICLITAAAHAQYFTLTRTAAISLGLDDPTREAEFPKSDIEILDLKHRMPSFTGGFSHFMSHRAYLNF